MKLIKKILLSNGEYKVSDSTQFRNWEEVYAYMDREFQKREDIYKIELINHKNNVRDVSLRNKKEKVILQFKGNI